MTRFYIDISGPEFLTLLKPRINNLEVLCFFFRMAIPILTTRTNKEGPRNNKGGPRTNKRGLRMVAHPVSPGRCIKVTSESFDNHPAHYMLIIIIDPLDPCNMMIIIPSAAIVIISSLLMIIIQDPLDPGRWGSSILIIIV